MGGRRREVVVNDVRRSGGEILVEIVLKGLNRGVSDLRDGQSSESTQTAAGRRREDRRHNSREGQLSPRVRDLKSFLFAENFELCVLGDCG